MGRRRTGDRRRLRPGLSGSVGARRPTRRPANPRPVPWAGRALLVAPLALALLEGRYPEGSTVIVKVVDDKIVLD